MNNYDLTRISKFQGFAVWGNVTINQHINPIKQQPFVSSIGLYQTLKAWSDPSDVARKGRHVHVVVFPQGVEQGFGGNLHNVKRLSVHAARPEKGYGDGYTKSIKCVSFRHLRIKKDDHIFRWTCSVNVPRPSSDVEKVGQIVYSLPLTCRINSHNPFLRAKTLPIDSWILGSIALKSLVQGLSPRDTVEDVGIYWRNEKREK